MNVRYTVSRCRKDDTFYGPVHGSIDGHVTLCGQVIDEHWWIVSVNFDGTVTCKKCQKLGERVTCKTH